MGLITAAEIHLRATHPCQANNHHRLQQGEEQERKEGVRPPTPQRPAQGKGLKQSLVDTALAEECPFQTQTAPEYLKSVGY